MNRMDSMKVRIFQIQKFCTHDGDGIRTTVFMAGCPLHCKWCHNPEGQSAAPRLLLHPERCIGCRNCETLCCGAQCFFPNRTINRSVCTACMACVSRCPSDALEQSVSERDVTAIIDEVLKDVPFYGNTGGLTLSGGEPMSQPEAAIALLQMAKRAGLNTAIETTGVFAKDYLDRLIPLTDTFLWDYKDSDAMRLRENTGADLAEITEHLRYADANNANIRLRCILIHGVNTERKHAQNIKALAETLHHLAGIDLILYHPMGQSKYVQLGMEDTYDSEDKIPTAEDVAIFREELSAWVQV